MKKATDTFTLNAIIKLNRYHAFRDKYERLVQNTMFKDAGLITDSWKLKYAKLKYKDKILLRIERGIIATKKALRAYEKAHGLDSVSLCIFSENFGCRN